MDFYSPRKLLFKAWNTETRLLMRLDSIECVKGELRKRNHVLLQFTGFHDKDKEELFEMDVVLIGSDKYVIFWNEEEQWWSYGKLPNVTKKQRLQKEITRTMSRICSYFQSDPDFKIRQWFEK